MHLTVEPNLNPEHHSLQTAGTSPSAGGGAAANGSALGSIII
jgi:hypothetical protein